MKILIIKPYPTGVAASQRFRFEQYLNILHEKGIEYKLSPFLDRNAWDLLYRPGNLLLKTVAIIRGCWRRLKDIFRAHRYDFVFIHREILPVGPPVLEFILSKILRKKLIFDFDDAIWLPNGSGYNKVTFLLKRFSNANTLMKYAYKVSCGNEYLCRQAEKFNQSVVYNPTTIDTVNHHNRVRELKKDKFVIGWTGSHSTLKYLIDLLPVFARLEKEFEFELHVISDVAPSFKIRSLVFKPWNLQDEIDNLLEFSVGVMPLLNDTWAEGKCGFKALQYLSLGIPALVTPVGVNARIIEHGVNGFHCIHHDEWTNHLISLITNPDLIGELSKPCRKKIEAEFSVLSNQQNFLNLFS
jgi:glycosyltransferase involved in cell wall biosynthesis